MAVLVRSGSGSADRFSRRECEKPLHNTSSAFALEFFDDEFGPAVAERAQAAADRIIRGSGFRRSLQHTHIQSRDGAP